MIADPMADLGGGQPGAASSEMGNATKEVVDPMAMSMNAQRIERVKNVMGIVSGCVAGICGLTGFSGLVCFLLWHVLVCTAIVVFKMNGNLAIYTKQSWFVYLTGGLQSYALSFTLFWTLFYGLVYLY
mmetsp:Transcript_4086/g.8755  ORF Transcript_4086/g.8755 Transcript_4086/m.8755 type:complete len:128 (-) Transcript_4086:1021-1404(-)|eukprot:CAMPEP_0172457800 /NCGR_PEP_ID=MMETSP1065-20121228/24268_1 /TAXON_ID=265537 /ORGANISM="Amphiprora paludosa, Strain CCMP125" /LENGTH=127 /DNA_ID=CAMNT_0013211737 /DNA_START=75 /DNA_END=458 /DNA_ORIENTATION=+